MHIPSLLSGCFALANAQLPIVPEQEIRVQPAFSILSSISSVYFVETNFSLLTSAFKMAELPNKVIPC